MSQWDRDILVKLSLSQTELAGILRASRQAVNAGIQQERPFLDSNRLLRVHDAFLKTNDSRAVLTASIVQEQYGIDVESTKRPTTISRDPSSPPPNVTEFWIFAFRPLEIEDGLYAHHMRQHFECPQKRLIYFVGVGSVADLIRAGE